MNRYRQMGIEAAFQKFGMDAAALRALIAAHPGMPGRQFSDMVKGHLAQESAHFPVHTIPAPTPQEVQGLNGTLPAALGARNAAKPPPRDPKLWSAGNPSLEQWQQHPFPAEVLPSTGNVTVNTRRPVR